MPQPGRSFALAITCGTPLGVSGLMAAAYIAFAALPPMPVPAENPLTEEKRALGKILFWDEQLSTSNTVSCGSCHLPRRAGADPRLARHPGDDRLLNTPDDVIGSPGVVLSSATNSYQRSAVFGLLPQATDRSANSPINAGYAPELFWDGRATGRFLDPQSGQERIASGGALESQAVQPPMSSVEMAHAGFDWASLNAKLARVKPLELATNVPADLGPALAGGPDYPELFRRAFGDPAITATRIAFAIASYQRTLVSDQSPWDRFMAGQTGALTPQQQQGWQLFQTTARCNQCHTAPHFTDHTFRNIGVRPVGEDVGRQGVTGLFADRGRFKVPSLRNVGLKPTFFHNGQFNQLATAVRFYDLRAGGIPRFPDNRDPEIQQIILPPGDQALITDFLANGLTDPRVRDGLFPFDKPTLYTDRPGNQPTNLGGGVAGTGGIVPRPVIDSPPMVGNERFRIGLDSPAPSAQARLAFSASPPAGGLITPQFTLEPVTTDPAGVATATLALNPWQFAGGRVLFAQWIVADASAPGGLARSSVARVPLFCGRSGCPCPADVNFDGVTDFNDLLEYLNLYNAQAFAADVNLDGVTDFNDLLEFLNLFNTPC